MIGRVARGLFKLEVMELVLLSLSLEALAHGISISLSDTSTDDFFWICLTAASLSFGLRKFRWNGIQASAVMVALGVLLFWILGARLTQPLLDLVHAILVTIPQIGPAIQSKSSIDTSAMIQAWFILVQASSHLLARLTGWLNGINRNGTIDDPLLRNMTWGLILWLGAAWMGWFAAKRNAIASLMPAMLLLAAIISYSDTGAESLWIMLILLLILMGMWNYRNHTHQWQKERIDSSDSIGPDIGRAVAILTLSIGAMAFITPSFSWHQVVESLRKGESRNETAEILGIREPPPAGNPIHMPTPFLPREYLLSGGYANSERIVMTVRTGELPSIPAQLLAVPVPSYYWRDLTYDQYMGAGWATSPSSRQYYAADTPLFSGLPSRYRSVHLDVKLEGSEGGLFWSGTLFSADTPLSVDWRVRPPSDLFADGSALLQADMFTARTRAREYRAEAYIPNVTVTDLRNAKEDYPEAIRVRYLSLPGTIPERVLRLARQIVEGETNPYDKAKAIESYLRENYPYDLDIPAPPPTQDVADYFLFDLKKGYCDYYATAMVVLARANGLPARFVSGYATGIYDSPNARYIIREKDAHSWAEVFFPEIGWIEFEPTASLPEIERIEQSSPIPDIQGGERTPSKLLTQFRLERILTWSSPLIGIVVSVILYFAVIEPWLVLRLAPQAGIERIYRRFYRAGRSLAGEWALAETSSEFLHKLIRKMDEIRREPWLVGMDTKIQNNAMLLTDLHHSVLFADYKVQKQDASTAWKTWTRLRLQLLFTRLLLFAGNYNRKNNRG